VPRFDPAQHRVRDVYTRVTDDQPVRIVIQATAIVGPIHSSPSFVFDYGLYDGHWLVDQAGTDIAIQLPFVRMGGALTIRVHDVTFPSDEPDWMFDGKLLAEHLSKT